MGDARFTGTAGFNEVPGSQNHRPDATQEHRGIRVVDGQLHQSARTLGEFSSPSPARIGGTGRKRGVPAFDLYGTQEILSSGLAGYLFNAFAQLIRKLQPIHIFNRAWGRFSGLQELAFLLNQSNHTGAATNER